jgi:hypothetical protein
MEVKVREAALPLDTYPPVALDEFLRQSGLSPVTLWRYRRAGWIKTINICGRHYLSRAEIARFNRRAEAGEFAKSPSRPAKR